LGPYSTDATATDAPAADPAPVKEVVAAAVDAVLTANPAATQAGAYTRPLLSST
jgi:hypothetical protein